MESHKSGDNNHFSHIGLKRSSPKTARFLIKAEPTSINTARNNDQVESKKFFR
jgi:hypothetical protein